MASIEDHIAPWRSVYKITQLLGATDEFRLANSGHIAGIINPPGKEKGLYWSAPSNPPTADEWFAIATQHPGSWWHDWLVWIKARSGKKVAAPESAGSPDHPPQENAPGTYVLET